MSYPKIDSVGAVDVFHKHHSANGVVDVMARHGKHMTADGDLTIRTYVPSPSF